MYLQSEYFIFLTFAEKAAALRSLLFGCCLRRCLETDSKKSRKDQKLTTNEKSTILEVSSRNLVKSTHPMVHHLTKFHDSSSKIVDFLVVNFWSCSVFLISLLAVAQALAFVNFRSLETEQPVQSC